MLGFGELFFYTLRLAASSYILQGALLGWWAEQLMCIAKVAL